MTRALTISLFFFISILTAQTVVIKGTADKSYYNKTITAFTYSDYVSKHELELSSSAIDDSGKFELKFSTEKTIYVFLIANGCRAEIYCEPNRIYETSMMPKDKKAIETVGNEVPVELIFLSGDTLELNYLIAFYNEKQENFINNNIDLIQNNSSMLKPKLDTFVVRMNRKLANIPNKSYRNYVSYSLASLQEKCDFKNREELFDKYIKHKPIVYESPEYMNFIGVFFNPVIVSLTESGVLQKQINSVENYQTYLISFSPNKYLSKNDTLRELVALKALRDAYSNPIFNKDRIIGMLESAINESKISAHKQIAQNLFTELNRMQVGTKPPAFHLPDKKGKIIRPEDFNGRYVYLMFVTSWCKSCEEELRLIPDLKKKYGSKIDFVTVFLDEDSAAFKKFIARNPKFDSYKDPTGWTFVHAGNNRDFKKSFLIKAVPTYYIINPQGNVQYSPALKPGIDLEAVFSKILKPAQKNFKPGEK